MKKIVSMAIFVSLLFAPYVLATPMVGTWNLENGLVAVLDPENDGWEIGDQSAGRDTSPFSSPNNEYYWRFDGLTRVYNILDSFVDNGDGTGYRNMETYRTGGTFKIHGDNLWGQAQGTTYEVSVESYFTGVNNYENNGGGWEWTGSVGTSSIWGTFKNDPFLFELTENANLDFYGYNSIVGHNVYSGTLTNVVMTISSVPEPATMMLFGLGLLGLAGINRKKKQ